MLTTSTLSRKTRPCEARANAEPGTANSQMEQERKERWSFSAGCGMGTNHSTVLTRQKLLARTNNNTMPKFLSKGIV